METNDKGINPKHSGPEHLVLTLQNASRALQRLLIAQTRASGLGLLEFLVLSRAAEDDGVVPGDVGRSLGLSTSTMTGISNRLEADGLIRRHPHHSDGRLLLLRPTAKGRRVRDRTLGPILAELAAEATALTDHERVTATRFLETVTALAHRHAETLSPTPARSAGRTSGPRRASQDSSARGGSQKDHPRAP